jgi:Lon protease-like protein
MTTRDFASPLSISRRNDVHKLRNKQEFLQRLDTTISRATQFGQFAADEPLNLANRTGKGQIEQEYDERLASAQRAHKDAEKALADKRRELVSRQATDKDLARILPTYESAVTRALQELNKISAQRYEAKDAARNQASLFGVGFS